jgi:hypothetical protein
MKRQAVWAFAGLLVVAAAFPAAAQEGNTRVRLDDFAVAPGDGSLRVEQVSRDAEAGVAEPQVRDRSIVGSPAPRRSSLGPDQLSSGEDIPVQTQLSDGSDPTGPIPTAGSTAADSRPQGVTRLAGSDRCDPQLPDRDLGRCLKILELRAEDFNAPVPPQLSAEQSLLGSQSDDERVAFRASGDRLGFATVQDPDANLDSNQELASIFLAVPVSPSIERAEELPEEAATLTDIIVAITQGSPPPAPE